MQEKPKSRRTPLQRVTAAVLVAAVLVQLVAPAFIKPKKR